MSNLGDAEIRLRLQLAHVPAVVKLGMLWSNLSTSVLLCLTVYPWAHVASVVRVHGDVTKSFSVLHNVEQWSGMVHYGTLSDIGKLIVFPS